MVFTLTRRPGPAVRLARRASFLPLLRSAISQIPAPGARLLGLMARKKIPSSSPLPGIRPATEKILPQVVAWRRAIHAAPELGFREEKTSRMIGDLLETWGFKVRRNIARTGVTGLLEGRRGGRTVLVRADMDALPLQETAKVPYRSRVERVMHACGHDGHVAIALGLARLMKDEDFKGRIVFCFQPAEEGPGGALPMIEEGVLEDPPVDLALGLHLWNDLRVGRVGVREGPLMASVDEFEIFLSSRGGHGAAPHQTVDLVVVASHLVLALQTIRSRRLDPQAAGVVTVGKIQSGTTFNVLPAQAHLHGTVRTFDESLRKKIEDEMRQITAGICRAHGAKFKIRYKNGYPVTSNNAGMAKLVAESSAKLLTEEAVVFPHRTMGGEDMSYFLNRVPGCFYFLGSSNPELGFSSPHHSPTFDFDEKALAYGMETMRSAVLESLTRRSV